MLNNPQWQQISLTSFKDWLKGQNLAGTYDWGDGETCLMAQYLQATRGQVQPPSADPPMPDWYLRVSLPRPWTFGAALARATDCA